MSWFDEDSDRPGCQAAVTQERQAPQALDPDVPAGYSVSCIARIRLIGRMSLQLAAT